MWWVAHTFNRSKQRQGDLCIWEQLGLHREKKKTVSKNKKDGGMDGRMDGQMDRQADGVEVTELSQELITKSLKDGEMI